MSIMGKRRFPNVLFTILLLVMTGTTTAFALDVNGVIATDTTWAAGDSPVNVIGDVLVLQGATLTIDPGVAVIFQPRADTTRGYTLDVEGELVAQGEETRLITFTAQDSAVPWGAIIFRDTSTDWDAGSSAGSVLSYCVIEYGGNAPELGAMVVAQNAMPRITNNAIRFSSSAGIAASADGDAATPSGSIQIIDNQIYSNPTGLLLDAEGGAVTGNYFLNNDSAVSITTQANGIDLTGNTITGSSGELFGAGILLQLGEPDNTIADYGWTQTSGPAVVLVNPNSAQPFFIAPDPASDVFTLTFDLTVTGRSGQQDTDSVEVTIIGANQPPVADAGGIQNVQRAANTVTLDATGSVDPDFFIAEYLWEQESGRSVSLQQANTATASFAVPEAVAAGEQMTFKLTVTDNGGLEASDTATVRYYQDNIYPQAVAGEEITAITGDTVSLDGSGSNDPDGGITAYQWQQTGGVTADLFNGDTPRPFFVAPVVGDSAETLTFELTVTDTGGLTDTAELPVRIKGSTSADPGEDQTVSAGDEVTLDGSASLDADAIAVIDLGANEIESDNGDASLLAITAVEGARYRLNTTGNNLNFTDTIGYTVYLFDWADPTVPLVMPENWWGSDDPVVIDGSIYDQADDLRLPLVNTEPIETQPIANVGSDLNYPPLADAGPDLETAVDLSVTLDGSSSYDPDGIGEFAWEQVDGPAVTIRNADEAVASFIAPSGGGDGELLIFRLTMNTGSAVTDSDEASVTVVPDEAVPIVETGGGCFVQSAGSRFTSDWKMRPEMRWTAIMGLVFVLITLYRRRIATLAIGFILSSMLLIPSADAGYIAMGGGGGGDADQYNFTLETGAKGIAAGDQELMFAFGVPFIPIGDKNLPANTIALPCPNNDCQPVGEVRKGTEVGFYGKLGIKLWSTNFYVNAIGGFTIYTQSELVQSEGSGFTYEESTDTKLEPLYGAGVSYFAEDWEWPILFQVDFDVTRGVTGTVGWHW
jgi:hypothetical protein